jgi:hypothetical protein
MNKLFAIILAIICHLVNPIKGLTNEAKDTSLFQDEDFMDEWEYESDEEDCDLNEEDFYEENEDEEDKDGDILLPVESRRFEAAETPGFNWKQYIFEPETKELS